MTLLLSMVTAYILAAFVQIRADLRLPALERPAWAVHPTLENAVLAGATWFVRAYVESRRATGRPHRALLIAFTVGGVRIASFTAFVWVCIAGAGYPAKGTVWTILTATLLILLGTPAVSAALNFLLNPLISARRRA